ncbi:putative membrane protein YgcG [Streptomyces avidinii]|uniref:Membrane protein YgcG n=2 Tax=Streptomyces avidinii TaxID=1895 RepID=A0ABS4LBJ4_STRAV|nr:putative membrane protein YgcG [Streptomyces avidinii]
MPWWVKWVAVPLLALFVFGGVITSILGALIGFVFKLLLFVGLVSGLVFVVKKFSGSGSKSSSGEW